MSGSRCALLLTQGVKGPTFVGIRRSTESLWFPTYSLGNKAGLLAVASLNL